MLYPIFLHIFSYDIWFYFSHIILHKKLYAAIHKDHHVIDPKTMTAPDTYVGHVLEGPFQGVGILFPFMFIPFDPYPILISLFLVNVRGMLRHDHRFIWLIGNHHILHHKYPRYNYGEYWLDKLFGTLYPDSREHIRGLICV